MRRSKHSKKTSFIGLFLLIAFISLYFTQLACDLPHLVQRLLPTASTQSHNHGSGHSDDSSGNHQAKDHTHKNTEHPDPSHDSTGCCEGQDYAPFVKGSPSVELPSIVKASTHFIGSLWQAIFVSLHRTAILAVSHAPPDPPVPKIPDIRVFLHSFII